MKQCSFIVFIFLFSLIVVKAQTSETVSQLKPVPAHIGKFSKRLPKVDNRIINRDNLKFKVTTDIVNLPDNKKGIAVIIQAPYQELVFESIGGKEVTRINIYGRITSNDKATDGYFEEMLSETADTNDLVNGINKDIMLRKVFELPQGNIKLE